MAEKSQQNSLLGKIAAYTEILAKDPFSTIFVSLSEAYRKMGMLDDARKVIEKGLHDHPDFSPAHIVRARILCQQGEFQQSEIAFKKALELDATSLAALVGYARLFILLGQEENARPLLLDAREISPADPVINKLLLSLPESPVASESGAAKEEESTASSEAEAVAEVSPSKVEEVEEPEKESPETVPLASSTLADLYLRQGLTGQALDMYRRLLADDPDNLDLRRKIRGIEEQSTESEPNLMPQTEEDEVAETAVAPQSDVASTVADDVVLQEQAEPEVATLDRAASASDESAEERVLAKLNRWLDSIKRRREDV